MRRVLSLTLVLSLLALFAFSVCAAAAADGPADAEAVPELDRNFDVDLATTLIIIICSVVGAVILVVGIVLAARNIHN